MNNKELSQYTKKDWLLYWQASNPDNYAEALEKAELLWKFFYKKWYNIYQYRYSFLCFFLPFCIKLKCSYFQEPIYE